MRPDYRVNIAAATARIKKQRDNLLAHYQRAYAEWCNYDHDQAIADYTEVLRLDPKDAQAYSGRSETYLSAEKYDLALKDYNTALSLNPNDAQAHTGRAWALWGTSIAPLRPSLMGLNIVSVHGVNHDLQTSARV